MYSVSKIVITVGILSFLTYCSGKASVQVAAPGGEVKAPAEANKVAARVTAESGATLSIGNSVQLTVPAGALNEDAEISVTKTAAAAAQETLVPVGASIELGAHGIEFNKPVALNICYDAAQLASQNLKEETLQVYYLDPVSGNYAAVGGVVNKGSHCVSAQLEHFSTYLVAAQILQGGNNPPVVSAPTFTPSVPLAGLPLKISSVITDFESSTVNGQVGFGQVATATLYYRIPGEPSFTQVALTPDYADDTATRYSYKIPANRVTLAGIEYYLKATDNLGLNRVRNTATLGIARTATSIAFAANPVVDLAAGFKRSYTVRAVDDLGTARNIDIDSFTLNGGIGTAAKTGPSVVQVTGTTANAQNYRIGSLTVNAGPFSVVSQDIRVHAGYLDHIALLSPTGVILGTSITVNAGATYDFDVLGYDAFGNTTNVLPQFVIVPVSGAGTITSTGLYTAPATAQTATLVATLDGVQDSILINVVYPSILQGNCNSASSRALKMQGDYAAVSCNAGLQVFRKNGNGQWMNIQTITEWDATNTYYVGARAISLSGDTLVASYPGGAAGGYIVVYAKQSSGLFAPVATVNSPDGAAGMGFCVATDGNHIAATDVSSSINGANSGTAYLFSRSGSVWSYVKRLDDIGTAYTSQYGQDCDISNGNLAISGMYMNRVAMYRLDGAGNWNYVQAIQPALFGQRFGSAIALDGDRLVVGDYSGYPTNYSSGGLPGNAHLFERDSAGQWNYVSELPPSDPVAGAGFGTSVDIQGDVIVVGAPAHGRSGIAFDSSDPYYSAGAVYCYKRNPSGIWQQQSIIDPNVISPADANGRATDLFGQAVVTNGVDILTFVYNAIYNNQQGLLYWQLVP